MHITLPLVILLSFFGCSTRIKNNYENNQPTLYTPPAPSTVPVKTNTDKTYSPKTHYNKRVNYLRKKALPNWGDNAKVASRYEYVKYVKNYKARTVINFETGTIRVETTATENPLLVLKEVIASTLLSTQNPEKVDLFSERNTIQFGEPFLLNRVKDNEGEPIRWQWRAAKYAEYLVDTSLHKENIETSEGSKMNYYVTFNMVQESFSNNSNIHYSSIVNAQAKRFGISPALIFALIETESHFNPFATSAIPAYGLMQVVPSSAGRDVWKFLNKGYGKPSGSYLFNAKNNIEMGSAYVHIILNRYLYKIDDPITREYCAIAAYNTGSGNVLRSFHKNKEMAFKKINSLSAQKVYTHLRTKLPYEETRNYIAKVTKAKQSYM